MVDWIKHLSKRTAIICWRCGFHNDGTIRRPNWADAPRWANWYAQDANGTWWWYGSEPSVSAEGWIVSSGACEAGYSKPNETSWKQTLSKRPAEHMNDDELMRRLGEVKMKFIDRATDVAPECGDPAERILSEWTDAVEAVLKDSLPQPTEPDGGAV